MIRNTQSAMEENHHGKVETSQSVRAAVESSTISKACQVRDNVPCTTEPVDIRATSIAPEYLNRGINQDTQGRTTNSMDDNSTKAGKHNTTSNTENDAQNRGSEDPTMTSTEIAALSNDELVKRQGRYWDIMRIVDPVLGYLRAEVKYEQTWDELLTRDLTEYMTHKSNEFLIGMANCIAYNISRRTETYRIAELNKEFAQELLKARRDNTC